MKLYHQTGHNYIWNIDSLTKDKAGSGLIFSPINIESEKILKFNTKIKNKSFFDPQFYLINELKGKITTYDYFPANFKSDFNTNDLYKESIEIAKKCIDFQIKNDFEYIVIPARYFDELPSKYYDQFYDYIISPFINQYKASKTDKKILLTIILKQNKLVDADERDKLLNWITSIQEIHGIYLIFQTNNTTKQIKDSDFLYNALLFIYFLKLNKFEVHIGYNNVEGLFYSLANPDSISMGSYENLRNFNIRRFVNSEKKVQNPPRARLYVAKLFQWLDYGYLKPITNLYIDHLSLFEDSKYRPLMFTPTFQWHFQKSEPYKHYFLMLSNQVSNLPNSITERIKFLEEQFKTALNLFSKIEESGVALDDNSNGTHLNFWLSALNMYKKFLKENPNVL